MARPEALPERDIAHTIEPEADDQHVMTERIKVTLKQGPLLEGRSLIAALKRLVEIGRRLERQARER